MTYQVLARKWRPKTFSDVVGQEHILTALINSLSLRRIHHAYLFSGTRGIGKTSIARLLAKGLNCKIGITAKPCGKCSNCIEIEQGRFVDLIEIDAASRTKVEDTRDLLDNVQYLPTRGLFKIYLIDEVHMLSRYSFNALLKTLEEPPSHVKFLLATTSPQKIPITIISRCLQFHLMMIDTEQIQKKIQYILDKEYITYEIYALQLLAHAADGSLRDALSLTDQAISYCNGKILVKTVTSMLGILNDDYALSLIEAIVAANGEKILTLINKAASRGIEWEALLVEMQSLLHKIAMIQVYSNIQLEIKTKTYEYRMRNLAHTVKPTDIQLYYQMLLAGRKELSYAPNRRIGIEITLLRILAFHPKIQTLKDIQHDNTVNLNNEFITSKIDLSQKSTLLQSDISEATNLVISAQNQLQQNKKAINLEKPTDLYKNQEYLLNNSKIKHLDSVMKKYIHQDSVYSTSLSEVNTKKEEVIDFQKTNIQTTIPKTLKKKFEHKKKLDLMVKLINEVIRRDAWAAEVSKLKLPKLVEQMALNSWKEQNGNEIRLHLRYEQRHLNSPDTRKILEEALTLSRGLLIKLIIIEDNDLTMRTPIELKHLLYEEKLKEAREIILNDKNIQMLQHFFDAKLDEDSIYPI